MPSATATPAPLAAPAGDAQRADALHVPAPRLWISEGRDEREGTVARCVNSPLLAACRQTGRAEVFGVWGGRDRSLARAAARPVLSSSQDGWRHRG